MSKQAQAHSKPVGEVPAVACRGYCGHQYQEALASVDAAHPEWTRVRRDQRAWIEMFKRDQA
jgi:hypothetical protein